jgi:general secretion pathway protein I
MYPHPTLARHTKQTGFTLVEILVALSVLGVAFATLLGVLSSSAQNGAQAQRRIEAAFLAENILASAGTERDLRAGARLSGEADPYSWVIQVDRADGDGDAPALAPLFDVAVTVQWTEGGKSSSLSLISRRLGPPTDSL